MRRAVLLAVLTLLYIFAPGQTLYNQVITLNPSRIKDTETLEKVYLHTDRDNYYTGDDIWFKAYLIDPSDRSLINHSNNLHVELISPASEITESGIVKTDNGLGNGDFRLDNNLKSGTYWLRAYTNYMRNFGDQLFFNKKITIINPKDSVKVASKSLGYQKKYFEINFFPEGGSLVDNVTSVVAFKAEDYQGEGCDVSGEIYSSAGEIVSTYKSTHKGMGTFSITPVSGLTYYALSKNLSGDSVKREIPKSFPTGIVLNVYRNKFNALVSTIKTNEATLPQILDHDLSLTFSSQNNAFRSVTIRIESLSNYFVLPLNDLPDGIVKLTLTGPDSISLCERHVFVQNNEENKLTLATLTGKTEYEVR